MLPKKCREVGKLRLVSNESEWEYEGGRREFGPGRKKDPETIWYGTRHVNEEIIRLGGP